METRNDVVRLGARLAIAAAALFLARGVPADPLTLGEAEARALSASPAARLAGLEKLAAEERAHETYARHLGDADLVGLASRYEAAQLVRPLIGPVGPATIAALPFDRDQLHLGATWRIPLFAGGALVLGDRAAGLAARAAGDRAAWAQDEVRYDVRAAYRTVLGVGHALDAARAYELALAQDEASARLRIRTEAWTDADAAKVSFALESARARRAALAARLRDARAVLAALMGEEGAPAWELEDVPAEPAPQPTAAEDDLARAAAGRRRDLAAAREAADAQSTRAGAVRAGFAPQLAFAGSWFANDGRSAGWARDTWELGLQVRIPILSDVGRTFAARAADAEAAEAAERARAKALQVRREVTDALGRVDAARAALDAGKAQRTLGAEVARVEKLKLDAETGKIEDYLAARAQQLEGETGYWQALYALQSAQDYLALVTGNGGRP